MVQKKFNVLQAVFAFTLMYTTIVLGILLRESPLTPIGIGVFLFLLIVVTTFITFSKKEEEE